MSELTDAAARLQAATVAHAAAARELGAAVARQIADADTLAALATQVAALAGQEPPPSDGIPDGADTVKIGTASYRLSGVNPTPESNRAGWIDPSWAGRGPDQLVIYRRPLTASGTNAYGTEAPVERGVLGSLTAGRAGGIAIPDAPGYVLSGHGKADDFLRGTRPGALVQVLKSGQPPPPPSPTGRDGNIALWVMMWSDSDRFDWAAIPDAVDEVRLSFLTGDGNLVGYGPWGKAGLQAGMKGFLAKRPGRFVSWAMGGGGYEVSIPSVAAYVEKVKAVERDLFTLPDGTTFGRFMGGNVDHESSRFRSIGDSIAQVLRTFKAERPGFYCSWSPNGSYKADYAAICRANPDVVDDIHLQSYDIPNLTYSPTVHDIYTGMFLGGTLKPSQLGIAMMIEPGRNDRWTLAQCQDAARRIRADLGITRTSFWHAGRPEAGAWASAMREINPAADGAH